MTSPLWLRILSVVSVALCAALVGCGGGGNGNGGGPPQFTITKGFAERSEL